MIVNMASTAGKHGPAYGAVYGATKAGLIAFTQGLRGELHGTGVSATVICPGFTRHGGIYEPDCRRYRQRNPFDHGRHHGRTCGSIRGTLHSHGCSGSHRKLASHATHFCISGIVSTPRRLHHSQNNTPVSEASRRRFAAGRLGQSSRCSTSYGSP